MRVVIASLVARSPTATGTYLQGTANSNTVQPKRFSGILKNPRGCDSLHLHQHHHHHLKKGVCVALLSGFITFLLSTSSHCARLFLSRSLSSSSSPPPPPSSEQHLFTSKHHPMLIQVRKFLSTQQSACLLINELCVPKLPSMVGWYGQSDLAHKGGQCRQGEV